MTITFTPELKITNLDQLSAGTGCRYLLVIESAFPDEYVAKRWLRKLPEMTVCGEHVIEFE